MKTYDSSVKLQKIKFDLNSINYKNEILSNEQILNRRWKNTEKALLLALPKVRKIYRQLGDEAINLLKDIDFTYPKLNQIVPNKVKRYVDDKIDDWKDMGLVSGYFKYLITSHTWTYKSVLELLLYGLYAVKYKQIKELSEDVFIVSAVDAYSQQVADRGLTKYDLLSLAVIRSLAVMPVMDNTYIEYLGSLVLSQVEEMKSFILINTIQDIEIDDDVLRIKMIKQANHILKIDDDKYSGALDDSARIVANQAYAYDTNKEDDLRVRFIAEIDSHTTRMCRSLDNQIFYVNKENTFKRYSAVNNAVVTVTCKGLVQGLNMPPINDHFHWCRSTLTYQLDINSNIFRMMKELFPSVSKDIDPKTYDKLIGVLKRIDTIKQQYGFKEDFKIDSYVEKSGSKKYIDGKNVLLDPKDEEILYAFKFQNEYKKDVVLRPRMRGKNAIQVSDYFVDGQTYDLKSFTGKNKRTIARKIKESKQQADNFIVKVNEGSRTPDEATNDIRILKRNNDWIKTIYLFDKDDNLVEIFE